MLEHRSVQLLDARSADCGPATALRRYCIPAAITHDGRYVITGSEDHKFIVWDVQTRQVVQSTESHKDVVIALARHPTRPLIATAGLEKVRLISTAPAWAATLLSMPTAGTKG